MSHQVIITFDLDENKVQENAEKEAGRQIARQVVEEAFGRDSYSQKNMIYNYVSKAVRDIIAERQDEIIKGAIEEGAKSLGRTKVVKEKLAQVIEEADHEADE